MARVRDYSEEEDEEESPELSELSGDDEVLAKDVSEDDDDLLEDDEDEIVEEDPIEHDEDDEDENGDDEDDEEEEEEVYTPRRSRSDRNKTKILLRVDPPKSKNKTKATGGKQTPTKTSKKRNRVINDAESDFGSDGDEEEVLEEIENFSRGDTPDVSKMTARQRARFDENAPAEDLLELSHEVNKKKILTAEEQESRRAEMARRRKNLSERRLEEEKQDTLDRLLKRRATKTRKRDSGSGAEEEDGLMAPGSTIRRSRLIAPHPAMTSWTSSRDKFTLSIPIERIEQKI